MKKILAVSGGIDSIVMLHFLKDDPESPIVAHFDHGIRSNSNDDASFVKSLADKYGLECAIEHAQLGAGCSEATARAARYDFLHKLAQEHHGIICVAHHSDDIVESIVINLLRGTGWRGLAPMNAGDIERPLKTWSKSDIYRYAAEHNLSFRQDQTNTEDSYLRNRVRERMLDFSPDKKRLLIELYEKQSLIYSEVNISLAKLIDAQNEHFSRELIRDNRDLAPEFLRFIFAHKNISLTRPQLARCADAIANYAPGKKYSLDRSHLVSIGKYSFSVI